MSIAAIDRVAAAADALVAALDAGEIGAIERANRELSTTAAALGGFGGWRQQPEVRTRLAAALRTAEAGRIRASYLADGTRRRLQTLMALGGVAPRAYGRDGRMRAI